MIRKVIGLLSLLLCCVNAELLVRHAAFFVGAGEVIRDVDHLTLTSHQPTSMSVRARGKVSEQVCKISFQFFHFQSTPRCLVIGGCGFLGRHLVERLLDKEYGVAIFDVRRDFDDERVDVFVGDLCSREVTVSRDKLRGQKTSLRMRVESSSGFVRN